jgi:dipeptidyl aminopeptidase/acylaminoacyl peptidase
MAPSPDGKRLFVDGFQARGELVRYDNHSRQFLPFLSGISAGDLSFSRDGNWLAYVSYPDRTLWRSRVNGDDRMQLTFPPVVAGLPHWSPDGKELAFVDIRAGSHWRIFLISAQGGAPLEMLAEDDSQVDAEWSPDGKQMIFGRPARMNSKILLLDVNSKQVSTLPGSEGSWAPRWCPDGRYTAQTADSKKILVFDFNTRKWSDWIDGGPAAVGYASWSRDGKYLFYQTILAENPGYYRVRLGDIHPELVVDLKNMRRFQDTLARGVGSPQRAPLCVRDLSTDEIYALDLSLP